MTLISVAQTVEHGASNAKVIWFPEMHEPTNVSLHCDVSRFG